jgi:phosphatidylserine decarboxylase
VSRPHQFVDRASGAAETEHLFADRLVSFLYGRARETVPGLIAAASSARVSGLFGALQFDSKLSTLLGGRKFLERSGIDLTECLEDPGTFTTPRHVFERKIRFDTCRPLPADPRVVVSPADSRVALGSLAEASGLFLKGKFFDFEELLGGDRPEWLATFAGGDFAVFRLTPEQYHYNHCPVAGRVLDVYELGGVYHSCNPAAIVEMVTPLSKNRRTVTILDTDVPGGTGVGKVAMLEVVALLIGRVEQAYSAVGYDDPVALTPGLFVERGAVKSFYRPGSSTDVLLFEPGRVTFAPDLVAHARRPDVLSRFSLGFGQPVVETEVRVRSALAHPALPGV